MNPTSGRSTPTTYNRQPRLQIPSSLPSLLQTELLLFDRLLRKNKPQHRSGLFYQKCTHVLRVMKRIAVVVSEVVLMNDGGTGTPTEQSLVKSMVKTADTKGGGKAVDETRSKRLYKTMTELINRALPALAKAFEVLEKMINHLHFLPLTTTLLAITSRLFVITIDVSAYVIQYRAATQELSTVDQSGARTLQPGNPKEKNRDHALLQLEDVVGMMVSGRLPSDRISTAQQQLEAKLSSLKESSVNAETRTLHSNSKSLAESKATMMEMDGEDFGEAIVLPRPATSSHIVSAIRVPPMPIVPVVLDPPSSPDETNVAPLPSRKSISKSRKMPRIPSESDKSHDPLQISSIAVFDLTKPVGEEAPPIPPHPSQKIMAKKRLADSETASTTKPTKRAISAADVEDTSGATVKVKKKKTKKGQDLMDDIFGL